MSGKAKSWLILALVVLAAPAYGQVASEIELTRAQIQTDRQALIAVAMELTEDEALAFWPIYRDYRVEMARIGDRLVKVVTEFAESDAMLTDEQATRLLDEYLALTGDKVKVQRKYASKFRKVVPATKATRFYQLENKLDAVVAYELAAVIPLTGERTP